MERPFRLHDGPTMKPILHHIRTLAPALAVALAIQPVTGACAAPSAGTPPPIEALLRVDALGYECIAETDLERAFQASGKPFHLPRTCLPAPCARQLSRDGLARVIGRPAATPVWDDYVARYAQSCVHEALWPGEAAPEAAQTAGTATFWAPILERAASAGPVIAAQDASAEAVRAAPILAGWGWSGHHHARRGPGIGPEAPPAPGAVPLPPAAGLLLSGLGALGFAVRRRRLQRPASTRRTVAIRSALGGWVPRNRLPGSGAFWKYMIPTSGS